MATTGGIRGFFQKAFPFLAAGLSLGGPVGNAAAAILGKVIGKPDLSPSTVDDALASITLTPELQAQLKEAELAYQQQMAAMGFKTAEDLLQIDAADRASARSMQVTTKTWVVPAMAITFVAGFFIVTVLKLFHVITAADQTVNDLITTLRDALLLILSYYFGSSAGSAAKNDIIASQAQPK